MDRDVLWYYLNENRSVWMDRYLVLLLTDCPLGDEFLGVLGEASLHLLDFLVHERLREHRFVDLVMSILPVTNLPQKKKNIVKQKSLVYSCYILLFAFQVCRPFTLLLEPSWYYSIFGCIYSIIVSHIYDTVPCPSQLSTGQATLQTYMSED